MATLVRAVLHGDALSVQPGDLVAGRYRVLGLLGRGGYGAVYSAAHTGTQQQVALKMMLGGDGDEHEVRRFYREAQVTASLRHPNTVRVFDVGQTDSGALFIAMELLAGPTLEDVLRTRRIITQDELVDIAIPILRSLGEAHAKGLVHRDLKPANIMLSRIDGADDETETTIVKVLDFGIARPQESSLTGQGTALGTPAYMSPEQCQGTDIDGRSDLYSLGVILYRGVCGTPPFADRNAMTVMFKHLNRAPEPLESAAKTPLSDDFAAVIATALAKNPDDRFGGAGAMRRSLELVRAGSGRVVDTEPYSSRSPSSTMRVSVAGEEIAGPNDRTAAVDSGQIDGAHGAPDTGPTEAQAALAGDTVANVVPPTAGSPTIVAEIAELHRETSEHLGSDTTRDPPRRLPSDAVAIRAGTRSLARAVSTIIVAVIAASVAALVVLAIADRPQAPAHRIAAERAAEVLQQGPGAKAPRPPHGGTAGLNTPRRARRTRGARGARSPRPAAGGHNARASERRRRRPEPLAGCGPPSTANSPAPTQTNDQGRRGGKEAPSAPPNSAPKQQYFLD